MMTNHTDHMTNAGIDAGTDDIIEIDADRDPYALLRGLAVAMIMVALMITQVYVIVKTGFGWDCLAMAGVMVLTCWLLYRCCPDQEYQDTFLVPAGK
jgi:hypothetical protein